MNAHKFDTIVCDGKLLQVTTVDATMEFDELKPGGKPVTRFFCLFIVFSDYSSHSLLLLSIAEYCYVF